MKNLNPNSQTKESDWPMISQWGASPQSVSISVLTGFIQVHNHGFRDYSCGWEGIPQRRGHRLAGTLANMFVVGENLNHLAVE